MGGACGLCRAVQWVGHVVCVGRYNGWGMWFV